MSCFIKISCLFYLINSAYCSGVRDFIKITFIYGQYDGQSYLPDQIPSIIDNPNFDRQRATAIYSYGFFETRFVPSVRGVIDAYRENNNFNFMVISCDNILAYTVFNANEIANLIADGLLKIFEKGYGNFHLVGFSLGAQIQGLIGRRIIEKSNGRFKIPRITGLDPGQLPPFFNLNIAYLSSSDAEFVDVIHSETLFFGAKQSIGHSNFWINGGILQPMCKSSIHLLTSVCSHLMAPKFWSASVSSKDTGVFPSLKCDSYKHFNEKNCEKSSINFMGLYTNQDLRGNYYLNTNHYPPYSRDL